MNATGDVFVHQPSESPHNAVDMVHMKFSF